MKIAVVVFLSCDYKGIACNWSFYMHKQYEASDLMVFEQWLKKQVLNEKEQMGC